MKPTNSTDPIDAMPDAHPLKAYYRLASASASKVEISPRTAQWAAWERYFDETCGVRPATMEMRRRGQIKAFTVPAEWPEHFDTRFAMDGATLAQGPVWSEEAAIRFVAMKRAADDAIEGGWISALVDHIREHHRMPTVEEADAMFADACKVDQRQGDIQAGVIASGMRHHLLRLAEAFMARRKRLANAIEAERIVIRSQRRAA